MKLLGAISIISMLVIQPVCAEQLDQSSLAAGLESSASTQVKHEHPEHDDVANNRWNQQQVRDAARRIFGVAPRPAPAAQEKPATER
jgi:hypothetical protein